MTTRTPTQRFAEITLDIAMRLYAVRRPLTKATTKNADIDLLSECVEDARDLVMGINPETQQRN